jgi:hypothetical protein
MDVTASACFIEQMKFKRYPQYHVEAPKKETSSMAHQRQQSKAPWTWDTKRPTAPRDGYFSGGDKGTRKTKQLSRETDFQL